MKVLIATDGSDGAIDAGRRGLALLAPGALVTVLAVVETPMFASAGPQSLTGGRVTDTRGMEQSWLAQRSQAESAAAATVAALDPSTTVEVRVEVGDAGRVICEFAAELPADVVIVGQRGLGRLRRALLGSVSSHVLQNAPCPVLAVRGAIT